MQSGTTFIDNERYTVCKFASYRVNTFHLAEET